MQLTQALVDMLTDAVASHMKLRLESHVLHSVCDERVILKPLTHDPS